MGFREFPDDLEGGDWTFDVDAGPVLAGFGFAACAFGVGGARANGHFEQAFPLATEMLATSWPLPDGTLLLPRLLSNAADAPYLGEAAILFNLTRQPATGVPIRAGGTVPVFTYLVLALQASVGLLVFMSGFLMIRKWRRPDIRVQLRRGEVQLGAWAALLVAALVLLSVGRPLWGMLSLLLSQLLPRARLEGRKRSDQPAR